MLATVDMSSGYYAEAEPLYQRSLAILEKSSPPDYSGLINVLNNYSSLLEQTKRKSQAELVRTRSMVYRAKLQEIEKKK